MPMNIAILASGSGTNAQRIIDMAKAGQLDVNVRLIISNRPAARVIERAKQAAIPFKIIDQQQFAEREVFDARLLEELDNIECDCIVLAGYMRLLSAMFLQKWANRVINIHPALLPSFPGIHGAADALAYGVKISGVTVHFVEEKMDSGPVVIQAAVPVLSDDDRESLQNRIHQLEYRIYPQALQWLAEDRLVISGRQVNLRASSRRQVPPPGNCLIWPPLEEGF